MTDIVSELRRVADDIEGAEEMTCDPAKIVDLMREAAGVVAAHRAARNEIRDWWGFDNQQQHTHSWHEREDFIVRWDDRVKAALAREVKP